MEAQSLFNSLVHGVVESISIDEPALNSLVYAKKQPEVLSGYELMPN